MSDQPLPELPDEAVHLNPTAPQADAAPGEKPPLRELDKAPAHLRKASLFVVVGALVPFMGHGGGWMSFAAGKVVVLLGVWFWLKQVDHNWGPALSGALGKLASMNLAPKKKEEDPKKKARRAKADTPAGLKHPFPTMLHVLSLLLVLVGCLLLPQLDPTEEMRKPIAMAELGMLAWAAFTWVHIHAYERWGNFNPLFPLMFLGIVFAGATRVIFGIGGLDEPAGILAVLGGGLVAIGGGLAAYTIVEALMEAKKQGDVKRQAAMEARRAARRSRSA